jgi:putative nucleotidyltransferase with HDIG domain
MNRGFRWYAILSVALAGGCLLSVGWRVPAAYPSAHWNAVAAFVVLGFLTDASYLRLRVGRTETQSSVAFISFIASVLLFDTGWAAAIAGCAVLASESVIKRKAPVRVAFNVAQMTLSVAVASLVYKFLGGGYALTPAGLRLSPVAIGGAIVSFFAVNSLAVSLAVSLGEGERMMAVWSRIAGASIIYDLFSSLLAPLLAFLYVRLEIPGILALVLPLYGIRHLYNITMQLEQVNRDLLELMVKAIEARDPYTSGHSQRVAQLAELLARELGLGAKVSDHIRTAALLHDVGKIHEEYAPLLRKQGKLDPTEKALMQTHSSRSADLVGTISAFRGAITEAVRHHHENFDGTGYPAGLSSKSIPIGARIIMIADTVDAMTTDRPYRKALTFERVTTELKQFAGRQFDPSLVVAFNKSAAIKVLISQRTGVPAPPSVATFSLSAPWRGRPRIRGITGAAQQ